VKRRGQGTRWALHWAVLGGAVLLATVVGVPALAQTQVAQTQVAQTQVNCDMLAPGPTRTDCYIGLARIHAQQSGIAAGVAQQQSDAAIYRRATGTRARKPARGVQ
jgi:hypothetical protein